MGIKHKKIIALALSLSMIVGCMPSMVMADEEPESEGEVAVVENAE